MADPLVVTGALGGAGRWLVDALRSTFDVVAIDRDRPADSSIEGVSFQTVDLTEQANTWETIVDADPVAVVHFGNIPHEEHHPGGAVFENNTLSTFNVLEAAGRAGARVVWASSETVYGTHWPDPRLPDSLPIDERAPVAPWNAYETSKLAGEAVAERVATAFDVPVATIRPSWIQYPGRYQVTALRESFSFADAAPSGNFWSYIDIRDVAGIVEAALAADITGHEVVNAVAADNYLGVETAEAVKAGYGTLPERCELTGEASAFSTEKAAALLDWKPVHSWREAEDEEIPAPTFD